MIVSLNPAGLLQTVRDRPKTRHRMAQGCKVGSANAASRQVLVNRKDSRAQTARRSGIVGGRLTCELSLLWHGVSPAMLVQVRSDDVTVKRSATQHLLGGSL